MNPLVTVNILSYNRKDELRNTLQKVYEQSYKNIEVIVVDNASTDGTSKMVKKEFPEVILIQLNENIGVAGWNKGFEIAKGDYVLVLDDDSYPEPFTISNGLKFFDGDDIGIIAFEIFNKKKNQIENRFIEGKFTNSFIGCGALIKKSVISTIEAFCEHLFLYSHEIEYSMRVLRNGYKIYFARNIRVIHEASLINRNPISNENQVDSRRVYYGIRNRLIILLLHFPIRRVLFRMVRIILGHVYASIRLGAFRHALKGVVSFIRLVPVLFRQRDILPTEIQKEYGFGSFAGGFFF